MSEEDLHEILVGAGASVLGLGRRYGAFTDRHPPGTLLFTLLVGSLAMVTGLISLTAVFLLGWNGSSALLFWFLTLAAFYAAWNDFEGGWPIGTSW